MAPDFSRAIAAQDELCYSGTQRAFTDVLYRVQGLVQSEIRQVQKLDSQKRNLVVGVLAVGSRLAGETVQTCRFRSCFGASVLAVHRKGWKNSLAKPNHSQMISAIKFEVKHLDEQNSSSS
jgi:hypothetical protein